METLYSYSSYRTFLADFIGRKKREKRGFSYSSWAKKLAVRSPATLAMIVNGQRNPGPELVSSLCRYFDFADREAEYFRDLVELEKSQGNPRLSVLVLERLASRHPQRKTFYLDHKRFLAISDWTYYAVREMVRLKDFREDPTWISEQLNGALTVRKARETLRTLVKLGLLARSADGRLEISELHADTKSDTASEGLKRFHEQILERAKLSIRTVSPSAREISGTTFAISGSKLPEAKRLIREFRRNLCQLLEEREAEAVYQLEIAFFPLTKCKTNHEEFL